MCWESRKLKMKTAKRNIKVWKVIYRGDSFYDTECHALYRRGFYYLKGRTEHTRMYFTNNLNLISGSEGFHSYSNRLKPIITEKTIFIKKKYFLGLREKVIDVYPNQRCIKIAEFCIPKGAHYAINAYIGGFWDH